MHVAQPCPSLMMPQRNIACDGEQVTVTTCNVGYGLFGSVNCTCLLNNTWSGEIANCNILLCEELENPENTSIVLPCHREYGSVCRIECLTGYFTTAEAALAQICS